MPNPFEPLTFRCGARAKNRLALAPLTNGQSHPDGTLGEDELRFLARRARAGFGLVETCAAHVADTGRTFDGQLGVSSDAQLPGLTRVAEAISATGALGVAQLQHGGIRAPSRLSGVPPAGPSAVERRTPGAEPSRALLPAEIEQVGEDFVQAASRAQRAGFQGIELHGAHGYLLGQFLSTETNRRTDAYGGSLENRARLLRSIVQEVRARVPASFLVGVRLSPEDFGGARGLDLDESIAVARWLCDDGVDLVHISLWDFRRNTAKRPTEHPVPLFRRALPTEVRLYAAGSVWTRAETESLLALGADGVAVGKAAIVNPEWPSQIEDPQFRPERGPLTPAQLEQADVGPLFVDYLRARFDGMVR